MELINFEEYKSEFKWDERIHFPVPTINYVVQRTGENLLSYYNTELEANGALIAATRSAKNYLFKDRTDMLAWEYYAARDIKLTYSVLEFIMEFINYALLTGDYIDFFKTTNTLTDSLSIVSAKQTLLGATKLLPPFAKVREGY